MSLNPRVLILAREDHFAEPLSGGLDRLGWRSVTARSLQGALAALGDFAVEVAVIDATEHPVEAFSAAARLKAEALPRRLPVLALGELDVLAAAEAVDVVLAPPVHPAQIAARLDALARAALADEELELRRETFREQGHPLPQPVESTAPLNVLTVGEPAPKFLALAHALKANGADTTGAFTPYTTFDYLHEQRFDAVVLWAGETHAEALSIASGMRRNTRLYHTPALLYLRSGSEVAVAQAFDRGLTDVVDAETPPDEAALRALSLARAFRRDSAVRAALDAARHSPLVDSETGLFPRALFAVHLARLAEAAQARKRPLSVAVFRVSNSEDLTAVRRSGALARAVPQLGSMIGRLVRAEDTVGRLSDEVFALAAPGASAAAARTAAERISAVIACTAFEAGEALSPFTIDLEVGVAELGPGESAAGALERAAGHRLAQRSV